MRVYKLDSYGMHLLKSMLDQLDKEWTLSTEEGQLKAELEAILLVGEMTEEQFAKIQKMIIDLQLEQRSDRAEDVWSDSCVQQEQEEPAVDDTYTKRVRELEEKDRRMREQSLLMRQDAIGAFMRHIHKKNKERKSEQENENLREEKRIRISEIR